MPAQLGVVVREGKGAGTHSVSNHVNDATWSGGGLGGFGLSCGSNLGQREGGTGPDQSNSGKEATACLTHTGDHDAINAGRCTCQLRGKVRECGRGGVVSALTRRREHRLMSL